MTKLNNSRLIGIFMLGGLAVIVVMIMLFGSGEYFKEKKRFVLYFEDSLSGLSLGAAVKFRGVTVGKVIDIRIQAWDDYHYVYTPVIIEVYVDKFHLDKPSLLQGSDLGKLIKKGLKAQLNPESFVTGVLYVELDFYPDKPAFFRDIKHNYPEIPTVISDFKQLEEKLENLQLDKIIDSTRELIVSANKFFSDPELAKTVAQLDHTLKSLQSLSDNVNQQVAPLSKDLAVLLKDTQKVMNELNKSLPELATNSNELVINAKKAIAQFDATLQQFDYTISDNSQLYATTVQAMDDLSQASRTINSLADYIERNPESLVWGK